MIQRKLVRIDQRKIFQALEKDGWNTEVVIDKSIDFVALSVDGDEYEASYCGPIDPWNSNTSHAFVIYGFAGRPNVVMVDPLGGVSGELGTKRIYIVERE